MLREEDILVQRGRAVHGGDWLRVIHAPTGITRVHDGPLRGVDQHALIQGWLAELETELMGLGLIQYLVPAYRKRHTRRHRH